MDKTAGKGETINDAADTIGGTAGTMGGPGETMPGMALSPAEEVVTFMAPSFLETKTDCGMGRLVESAEVVLERTDARQ